MDPDDRGSGGSGGTTGRDTGAALFEEGSSEEAGITGITGTAEERVPVVSGWCRVREGGEG